MNFLLEAGWQKPFPQICGSVYIYVLLYRASYYTRAEYHVSAVDLAFQF